MASKNRVIWDEGLFIRPHHFQQEARYVDYLVNQKIESTSEFLFGFQSLEINEEYLGFGKFSIQKAKGSMPDGTVFDIPGQTSTPEPLTIDDASMINQIVYLCLPLKSDGISEVGSSERYGQGRYFPESTEMKDTFSAQGSYDSINIAKVNVKLMLEREDRSSYTSLAIARIADRQPDNSISIDTKFYPVSTSLRAVPMLKRFLGEMAALMRERSVNIANRVGSPSQAGVADVTDFMMLLSLNRLHPYFIHLSKINHVHPERLYEAMVSACGELSTFVTKDKVPEEFVPYNHDLLHVSFLPLEESLRTMLGTVMQAKAVSIPVIEQKYGTYSAPVNDLSLLESADFILAIKANVPTEMVRKQFTQQTKISSLDKINELINLQLSGIPLIPLPVAPRYLPYHAGFTYFQLDRNDASWGSMKKSTGFGFHIAGEYQGLEIEFWAIRSSS